MPMAISSAMMPLIVSAVVSPGIADHVEADRADRRHRLQLLQREHARLGGGDHTRVLADRDERTREAADVADDAMTPPFFTASLSIASAAVVPGPPQTSSPMDSRMQATLSPTAGVGRKRQIDDAVGHAEALGCLIARPTARRA